MRNLREIANTAENREKVVINDLREKLFEVAHRTGETPQNILGVLQICPEEGNKIMRGHAGISVDSLIKVMMFLGLGVRVEPNEYDSIMDDPREKEPMPHDMPMCDDGFREPVECFDDEECLRHRIWQDINDRLGCVNGATKRDILNRLHDAVFNAPMSAVIDVARRYGIAVGETPDHDEPVNESANGRLGVEPPHVAVGSSVEGVPTFHQKDEDPRIDHRSRFEDDTQERRRTNARDRVLDILNDVVGEDTDKALNCLERLFEAYRGSKRRA